MIDRLVCAAALVLSACPFAALQAETLPEAIATAYESNPELVAARARQDALAETPEQARAIGRPTVSLGSQTGYDRDGGTTGTASADALLPIWTGGRVSSAVRAVTSEVAAGAEGLRDIEAAVLQRVVIAYAALLYNQQAVEVARAGIERLDRQVAEARSRFQLGQSTLTDVAQLESQRARVIGNLAEAEGALATAAALYRAEVGRDAAALSAEVMAPSRLPASRGEAQGMAEANSPLLLQQRRLLEASAARIDQARAEGAPSLDLAADYGRGARLTGGELRRFGATAAVGLTMRVPLLTGGLVPSRIRQARAINRAERFQLEAAARETMRATDAAWASLIAAQGRLQAETEGLTAAGLALRGLRAEYGFGLRTTTDILVADQSFREAQLGVALARADVLIAQAALMRAIGSLDRSTYEQ